MTTFTLNRAQVRLVDQRAIAEFGMVGLVLMENAGRGCVDVLVSLGVRGPVVIACGKGNNGGDGYVIARHLDNRGIPARVLLWCNPTELSGDAAANFQLLRHTGVGVEVYGNCLEEKRLAAALGGAEWVVDALLGTGAAGEPRSPIAEVIAQLNAHPAKKLAVDLPSGLDCDTGRPAQHTFRANHTCTFVAPKPGFFVASARPYVGELHVVDIGVPRRLVEEIGRVK